MLVCCHCNTGDCIGVVMSGVWLSFSIGWLSCQSDCPNVEQSEISPRGLVLGETWASGVCLSTSLLFIEGYKDPVVSLSVLLELSRLA